MFAAAIPRFVCLASWFVSVFMLLVVDMWVGGQWAHFLSVAVFTFNSHSTKLTWSRKRGLTETSMPSALLTGLHFK